MNNDEILLKSVDIQEIADKGTKIYETIKVDYEPQETGKFLAIEVESGKAYLAETSAEAVSKAKSSHPNKVFYVVKIGYDVAQTLAEYFLNRNPK